MGLSKRIFALQLLQRITQHEIDTLATRLTAIRHDIAALTAQHSSLQESLDTQAYVTTLEAAPYLGRFISAVRQQQKYLTDKTATLDTQARELEDQIFEQFRKKKTLGAPLQTALATQLRETSRKEALANESVTPERRKLYAPQA